MFRISALTGSGSSDESEDDQRSESTKEAKESEAFALYNRALQEQRGSNIREAESLYHSLLESSFLEEVEAPAKEGTPLVDPAAILKYSAYKNLGNLALERGDQKKGVEYLLEAVSLDSTDVTVWYKIGSTAIKFLNLVLANISLRAGLRCNPNHWPSLDCIITVLYAISNYTCCLRYIAKILEKDARHLKAHAFKAQILKEDAYSRRHADGIFKNCPESVHNFRIKKQDIDKYVSVALKMREERRELAKTPPLPVLKFRNGFKEFTWRHLGEQLIQLYDYVCQSDPHISYGSKVDLSPHLQEDDTCEDGRSEGLGTHSEGSVAPMETDTIPERQSEEVGNGMMGNQRHLSSSESHTQTTDASGPEMEELQEKSHKSHKRRRGLFGEPAPGKRRSARVRNTEKKKEVTETVDYIELLQRFLPSTLMQSNSEEPMDASVSPSAKPKRDSADPSGTPDLPVTSDLKDTEGPDVEEFMKQNIKNCGVPSVMRKYLVCLAKHFNLNWSRKLCTIYIEVYIRMRKHHSIPALFFQDDSDRYKRELGVAMLVYMELCLDKWKRSKTHDVRWKKFVQPDMVYLHHLSVMPDLMKDVWPDFPLRAFWMRAHYFVMEGVTAQAVQAYDECHRLFKAIDPTIEVVYLPNVYEDKIITKDTVERKKDTLRRTQSHEEITKLFEEKKYERVADILLAVMDSPWSDEGEQVKQRRMLVMTLLKISDNKNLVICFYKILKEYWEKIQGLEELPDKIKILKELDEFFDMLVSSPMLSTTMFVGTTPRLAGPLSRLLIDLIDWTMRSFKPPEEGVESYAPTVLPWVVLYFLLKSEEDKLEAQKLPGSSDTVAMETNDDSNDSDNALLPSSIMLLDTAHENLGRKSWCCNSEGIFLKLKATVILRELNKFSEDQPHPSAEDLQHLLEQCFYCLYGHPHRRAKAKHLQDHGVEEVELTWEYGKFMFNYFKPKMLPEFDGYKTSAMSVDLENLFLRVTKVIPMTQRSEVTVEKIHAYIDGTSDDAPVMAANIKPDSPVVSEIFYLLADYYFKNKEFGKANKFYIHDICFCPNRLDSWAGLALAKSGRLELKLNSCDAKAEGGVYKQGMGSLRCFHRALEIDQSNRSLWIEYGSFAYILQSHASRQLKQQDQIQLSEESIEGLKVKQAEMLTLSEECFRKVKDMGGDEEGEEWLIHYMLGKIAEKRGEVKPALDHYLEAMDHLYNDGAKFPKKISYHNPPDLALESLEMYFRIHAAVLKTLEKCQTSVEDIPYDTYEEVLYLASIQPFVKRQEKKLSELSSEQSTDEQESVPDLPLQPPPTPLPPPSLPLPPPPTSLPVLLDGTPLISPPYISAPQDHDYARIKKLKKQRELDYDEITSGTQSEGEESIAGTTSSLLQKLFPNAKRDFPLLTKQLPPPAAVKGSPLLIKGNSPTPSRDSEQLEETEDELAPGKREEDASPERRFQRLVTRCLKAMSICLQRFPQHYKSLYRITYWYLKSQTDMNLQWCYDLLLGSLLPWQQQPHMPSPALFGEHSKTKNIFQGIWRIPIADIDRSGSFSWHMYRSVTLLIEVLGTMKDVVMLSQIASKLARTPEQGKKFLRDSDRPHLALRAFRTCLRLLTAELDLLPSLDTKAKLQLLMRTWNVHQIGQHSALLPESETMNKLLVTMFRSLDNVKVMDDSPILDQAVHYCQLVASRPLQLSTYRRGDLRPPGSVNTKESSQPTQTDVTKLQPGRASYLSTSPVRATYDRPQIPERLSQVRSPGSLGLGPTPQPRRSPDGSPRSFMMSDILAPETTKSRVSPDERDLSENLKSQEDIHKAAPSLAESVPGPDERHIVETLKRRQDVHRAGPSHAKSVSGPDERHILETLKRQEDVHGAGPSPAKTGPGLVKTTEQGPIEAGLPINKMEKNLVDPPPQIVVEESDPEIGQGTVAKGSGFNTAKDTSSSGSVEEGKKEEVTAGQDGERTTCSTGTRKTSPADTEMMDRNISQTETGRNQDTMKTGKGDSVKAAAPRMSKLSLHEPRNATESGARDSVTSLSVSPMDEAQARDDVKSPPPLPLPPAPRPDLGQHLNSLLQRVRTGLKMNDKAKLKKLPARPAFATGAHIGPARKPASHEKAKERKIVPAQTPLLIESSSQGSKSVQVKKETTTSLHSTQALKESDIIGRGSSSKGEAVVEVHSSGSAAESDQDGTSVTKELSQSKSPTDRKEAPPPLMSDASEKERARFDEILNSLKTSEGVDDESAECEEEALMSIPAAGDDRRRPDELSDILDSLKMEDSMSSGEEAFSPKGKHPEGNWGSVTEDKPTQNEPLMSGEETASTSLESDLKLLSRGISDHSEDNAESSTSVPKESNPSNELTKILSTLKRPKQPLNSDRKPSSSGLSQDAGNNVRVTAKGSHRSKHHKTSSNKASKKNAKKRPKAYIEILNSLKRQKVDSSHGGKGTSNQEHKAESKAVSGSKEKTTWRPSSGSVKLEGVAATPKVSKTMTEPRGRSESDKMEEEGNPDQVPRVLKNVIESSGNSEGGRVEGKGHSDQITSSDRKQFLTTETASPVELKQEEESDGKCGEVGQKNVFKLPIMKVRSSGDDLARNTQALEGNIQVSSESLSVAAVGESSAQVPAEQSGDTVKPPGDSQGPQGSAKRIKYSDCRESTGADPSEVESMDD